MPTLPDDSPFLCIGHSHLHCVQAAAKEAGVALDAIAFWVDKDTLLQTADGPLLAPHVQRRLREHQGPVFSFIGGSAHSVYGIAAHPRPFDFILPDAPELPLEAGAQVLPYDVVHAIIQSEIRRFLDLMQQVRSLADGRVFHLQPPAPCGDAELMRPHIRWPLFPGMLHKVAPRLLHYKLWRLHNELVAAHCREIGMEFVAHLPNCTDEQGFLLPEYFHKGIHANSLYGARLIEQMRGLA